MGLVRGQWRFADASQLPVTRDIAAALADATGLKIHCIGSPEEEERIDISTIRESLVGIERVGSFITLWGYIPAHPYLWENLDVALSALGGNIELKETYWHPDSNWHHLRQPWHSLTARQRFLLRFPSLGASRGLDRFV